MKNKSHKGLVKRLITQLEIDIDLEKAIALCNSFHRESSQGEPVAWARKWFVDGTKPYKEPNENGRVSWAKQFRLLPMTKSKILNDDVPLYATPQPELFGKVEQLKIEKAELIEYAKYLRERIDTATKANLLTTSDIYYLLGQTLISPKPKCMENELWLKPKP